MIECKEICTDGEYKDLFIKKERYNYSKESYCKTCKIGIKKTTFRDVLLKIGSESDPNTHYYNIAGSKQQTITIVPVIMQFEEEVICPCCGAEAIGKKLLPKFKEGFRVGIDGKKEEGEPVYIEINPLENKEKSFKEEMSYKELTQELQKRGLKPPSSFTVHEYRRQLGHKLRVKTNTKSSIERFLYRLDSYGYDYKLMILTDYDSGGLTLSDDSQIRPIDSFIILLDELNNDKQREHYIRKFLKILDKFARKYKLGMGGLTQEEQDIEAKKRLEEGDRRWAEIGPGGRWIFPYPIYNEDGNEITRDETESKTNHVT